jgi:hypothetical protein
MTRCVQEGDVTMWCFEFRNGYINRDAAIMSDESYGISVPFAFLIRFVENPRIHE